MTELRPTEMDWEAFKAFVIAHLQPPRLLDELRKQRQREPNYPYCYQYFWRFRDHETNTAELSARIARFREDPAVAAAIARIDAYGFEVRIGTYDEPGHQDLFVGMKQDLAAELRMKQAEGLD